MKNLWRQKMQTGSLGGHSRRLLLLQFLWTKKNLKVWKFNWHKKIDFIEVLQMIINEVPKKGFKRKFHSLLPPFSIIFLVMEGKKGIQLNFTVNCAIFSLAQRKIRLRVRQKRRKLFDEGFHDKIDNVIMEVLRYFRNVTESNFLLMIMDFFSSQDYWEKIPLFVVVMSFFFYGIR